MDSRRLKPILAFQALDAGELALVGRYKRAAQRDGMRGDKEIASSDRTSLSLKARPYGSICDICGRLERCDIKSLKRFVDTGL